MSKEGLSNNNILGQLEKHHALFVNILFTDALGELKSVEIPAGQLEDALVSGISFDGSSIQGFAEIEDADMYLKPDISTLKIHSRDYPKNGEIGVSSASLIADPYTSDGICSVRNPRYILKRFLEGFAKQGITFMVGVEPEFFLFPEGRMPMSREEITSKSGYFALVPGDKEEEVRKAIVASLMEIGIPIEKSHHEIQPYINELSFKYDDPVTTADRLLLIKFVAKGVAARHGFKAVFMPKPIARFAACGMHVHMSVFRNKENAFYSSEDSLGLSQDARFFIGGLIEHIGAITALTNPTVNSYKRLVPGFEAPVNVAWARNNRSTLIRVPATRNPELATRIELRSPDPSANPYLAFVGIIAAGMDGIEHSIEPPVSVEENIYLMDEKQKVRHGIKPLPGSLEQTIHELSSDKVVASAIGKETTAYLVKAKLAELAAFNESVTDWERERYIDV
jgi:glutamine synthetase